MTITLNWTATVGRQTVFENVEEHYKTGVWLNDGVEQGTVEVLLDEEGNQTLSDAEIIEGLAKPWLT